MGFCVAILGPCLGIQFLVSFSSFVIILQRERERERERETDRQTDKERERERERGRVFNFIIIIMTSRLGVK